MSEIVDYEEHSLFAWNDPAAMERRIFYGMCVTVALSVLVGAAVLPWKWTTGLLLGGLLSLLNHHWLKRSIAAAFGVSSAGQRPQISLLGFLFRYFVAASAIAAAHLLGIASITAALAGMCSFVVAALVEAFIQTFFAITRREEN